MVEETGIGAGKLFILLTGFTWILFFGGAIMAKVADDDQYAIPMATIFCLTATAIWGLLAWAVS